MAPCPDRTHISLNFIHFHAALLQDTCSLAGCENFPPRNIAILCDHALMQAPESARLSGLSEMGTTAIVLVRAAHFVCSPSPLAYLANAAPR